MANDQNGAPKFTEHNRKNQTPQEKAKLRKSDDNVNTANQELHEPNHPHPGQQPEGKHSGGSDSND